MRLMHDLHSLWNVPGGLFYGHPFVPTQEALAALRTFHPDDWGSTNARGKALSAKGLSGMLRQVVNIYSTQNVRGGPRGYLHAELLPAWCRLGVTARASVASVASDAEQVPPSGGAGLTDPTSDPMQPVQSDAPVTAASVASVASDAEQGRGETVTDPISDTGAPDASGASDDDMCPDHPHIRLVGGRCGLCIAHKHNRRTAL